MSVLTTESTLYKRLNVYNWRTFINHKPNKAPINPNELLTLDEALERSPLVGMVISKDHPIVAFDLDGVSLDNPKVANMLKRYPTYVEHTPSNKPGHYRLIYWFESKSDIRSKPKIQLDKGHIEFFNNSANYITLTGNRVDHPDSIDTIAELPLAVLTNAFPSFKHKAQTQPHTIPLRQNIPIKPELWVDTVPCNREHPLVIRYCNKHGLDYQTYWLYGVMALHHTIGPTAGFDYADTWSQKAGDEYNPEELRARWQSLHEEAPILITIGTYIQYYNECVIPWPAQTRAGTPIQKEKSNTQAFLTYHELALEVDAMSTTPFIVGPDHALIPRYYRSRLDMYTANDNVDRIVEVLSNHVREFNYKPDIYHLKQHLVSALDGKRPFQYVNRYALWIDTLPAYDPKEGDYLTLLANDIIQRDPDYEHPNQEFHNMLIRKWMLSLGRTMWSSHKASSEGLLILHGPPGIYKSSLGKRLLPREFQDILYKQTNPNLSGRNYAGMSYKDYKSAVCSRLIVDYDEAEEIFSNNSEAVIKSEVTAMVDTFRPAYGRHMLSIPRKYSILASTNERRLQIPYEGDRRYWWLNVKHCDTYLLDEWPVDHMWKQIEFLLEQKYDKPPWILTQAESDYLSRYLRNHRLTNNVEDLLAEEFEWETLKNYVQEQIDAGKRAVDFMLTTPQILERLHFMNSQFIKRPALNRALIRLNKQHAPKSIRVKQTWIKEGYHETGGNQKLYMFPPKRN